MPRPIVPNEQALFEREAGTHGEVAGCVGMEVLEGANVSAKVSEGSDFASTHQWLRLTLTDFAHFPPARREQRIDHLH